MLIVIESWDRTFDVSWTVLTVSCFKIILDTVLELCWQYFGYCLWTVLTVLESWFESICNSCSPGVWAGHHLQLWESLLHVGWVHAWGRGAGNQQEECAQGHCCSGSDARGQLPPFLHCYLPPFVLCIPPQLDDHNIDLLLCNVVLCFWPYLPLCTGPLASLCGVFLLADLTSLCDVFLLTDLTSHYGVFFLADLTSLCGVFFLADLTSLCGVFFLADLTPFVVCSS